MDGHSLLHVVLDAVIELLLPRLLSYLQHLLELLDIFCEQVCEFGLLAHNLDTPLPLSLQKHLETAQLLLLIDSQIRSEHIPVHTQHAHLIRPMRQMLDPLTLIAEQSVPFTDLFETHASLPAEALLAHRRDLADDVLDGHSIDSTRIDVHVGSGKGSERFETCCAVGVVLVEAVLADADSPWDELLLNGQDLALFAGSELGLELLGLAADRVATIAAPNLGVGGAGVHGIVLAEGFARVI